MKCCSKGETPTNVKHIEYLKNCELIKGITMNSKLYTNTRSAFESDLTSEAQSHMRAAKDSDMEEEKLYSESDRSYTRLKKSS